MAEVISAIKNNVIPGPKRSNETDLFILKLDRDPSESGVSVGKGTLAIYNEKLYIKTGEGSTDWLRIKNATEIQNDIINNSLNSLEGMVFVDRTNSANDFISSDGLFSINSGLTIITNSSEIGVSASYGAEYVTFSDGLLSTGTLYAAEDDLNIYPNNCPYFSSTIKIENDRTQINAGFISSSNDISAFIALGRSLNVINPQLGVFYQSSSSSEMASHIIDSNYTDYQDIHNLVLRFNEDGSLSYYIYNLGDGSGTARASRSLVASGTLDNSDVPSGSDILTNTGFNFGSAGGTSLVSFFNQKLILNNP